MALTLLAAETLMVSISAHLDTTCGLKGGGIIATLYCSEARRDEEV